VGRFRDDCRRFPNVSFVCEAGTSGCGDRQAQDGPGPAGTGYLSHVLVQPLVALLTEGLMSGAGLT
jgi:hypothetical protein